MKKLEQLLADLNIPYEAHLGCYVGLNIIDVEEAMWSASLAQAEALRGATERGELMYAASSGVHASQMVAWEMHRWMASISGNREVNNAESREQLIDTYLDRFFSLTLEGRRGPFTKIVQHLTLKQLVKEKITDRWACIRGISIDA